MRSTRLQIRVVCINSELGREIEHRVHFETTEDSHNVSKENGTKPGGNETTGTGIRSVK